MIALILAGGSGTRLWPLSMSLFAKQFISFNSNHSLLQETVKKAIRHCDEVVIVTNNDQYFLVKHQVHDLGVAQENIVKEPISKNTAPAIVLGCKFIEEKFGNTDVLVMPSDHILDESFFKTVKKTQNHVKKFICTFGVKPTFPSTEYGYIKIGAKNGEGYFVDEFVEKPDKKQAASYLSLKSYLWNSGIFLLNIKKLFREVKMHLPNIHAHLSSIPELLENYSNIPSTSIDFGLMEKTKDIMVFPYDGGWNDLGTWKSVYEILKKDSELNAKKGDIISIDTKSSLIIGDNRLISTIGISDLLIVDTKDALLVASKSRAEEVKNIVKELNKDGRNESSLHSTVYRPWGYYTVLEEGRGYKVKRIAIYPHESISLQMHKHRSEHWIVVKGTARITKDDEVLVVHENESIYVPQSMKHRVENPGESDLQIIEIQTGEYVEEDDIIRFKDKFGRI